MPLPLVVAPLVPLALRLGAMVVVGYVAKRALFSRIHSGRTDQRAEDALDALDEGLGLHAPTDTAGQRNAAVRVTRTLWFRGRSWQLDARAIARWSLRETR